MKFNIGDKVKCVEEYGTIAVGELGTVCHIFVIKAPGPKIGVNWDKKKEARHNCNKQAKEGHGYYVYPKNIMKVDDRAWKQKCKEADKIMYHTQNERKGELENEGTN